MRTLMTGFKSGALYVEEGQSAKIYLAESGPCIRVWADTGTVKTASSLAQSPALR